jgi:hypothetical protein
MKRRRGVDMATVNQTQRRKSIARYLRKSERVLRDFVVILDRLATDQTTALGRDASNCNIHLRAAVDSLALACVEMEGKE